MNNLFQEWLEARTYADQVKYVYHWDTESDWYKVLQKQGLRQVKRKNRPENPVKAVWVSPSKDANESWATWAVSAAEAGWETIYLHTIAMPRALYHYYYSFESKADTQPVKEFVINERDWNQLTPVSVKPYRRSDVLRMATAFQRRAEMHRKLPHGINNDLDTRASKNSPEYLRRKQQEAEWAKGLPKIPKKPEKQRLEDES